MTLSLPWHVVRRRKLIVSGPTGILEEDAKALAVKWNMLYVGADYEAVSDEETKGRHARPVDWKDAADP
jgi:hypothetical protein